MSCDTLQSWTHDTGQHNHTLGFNGGVTLTTSECAICTLTFIFHLGDFSPYQLVENEASSLKVSGRLLPLMNLLVNQEILK